MHTKCDITTDKMPGRYLGRPSKIDRSHSSEWISNKFNVAHMLRTVIALIIYCNDLRIMRQNMFSHRNGQCNILKNKQFTCQKSFQCSAEWNWPRVPRIFLFFFILPLWGQPLVIENVPFWFVCGISIHSFHILPITRRYDWFRLGFGYLHFVAFHLSSHMEI